MKLLGIDYGEKKIGIAIAEGSLAEPLVVFRPKNRDELFSSIANLASDEEIEKMISAVPDEKTKKDFESGPQREYIKQILLKRKVIDSLLNL